MTTTLTCIVCLSSLNKEKYTKVNEKLGRKRSVLPSSSTMKSETERKALIYTTADKFTRKEIT